RFETVVARKEIWTDIWTDSLTVAVRLTSSDARSTGLARCCARRVIPRSSVAVRMTFIMHSVNAIVESAKYHLTGSGLQYAGDRDIDGSRNQFLGVVDHYHGSVIEVRDALVILFAFLQNEDAHGLAR